MSITDIWHIVSVCEYILHVCFWPCKSRWYLYTYIYAIWSPAPLIFVLRCFHVMICHLDCWCHLIVCMIVTWHNLWVPCSDTLGHVSFDHNVHLCLITKKCCITLIYDSFYNPYYTYTKSRAVFCERTFCTNGSN